MSVSVCAFNLTWMSDFIFLLIVQPYLLQDTREEIYKMNKHQNKIYHYENGFI